MDPISGNIPVKGFSEIFTKEQPDIVSSRASEDSVDLNFVRDRSAGDAHKARTEKAKLSVRGPRDKSVSSPKYKMHVISHSHMDREWYLPDTETRKGFADVVDRALELMEKDPDYKFMLDGQSVILEDYIKERPEKKELLTKRIKEGKLLVGPWYTMPDEFLPNGESIIRNLMIGDKVAKDFGGKSMKVGYSPDPFGHNSQMPQILKGFDIDSALIWRGVGIEPEKLHSELNWQSPDGSKVFTVYLPYGYGNAENLTGQAPKAIRYEWAKKDETGNVYLQLPVEKEKNVFDPPEVIAERLREAKDNLVPFAVTNDLLLMDGGDQSMPQYFSDELARDINKITQNEGICITRNTLPDYIEKIKIEAKKLNTIKGEQRSMRYAPLLPGVISSRMHLIQKNNEMETLAQRWAEPLSTFSSILGKPYPQKEMLEAWKTLIKTHPHDDITGCGTDEVAKRNDERYEKVEKILGGIVKENINEIASNIDTSSMNPDQKCFVVFNSTSGKADHCIEIKLDVKGNFVLQNSRGKEIPYQFSKDGKKIIFQAKDLPPMGYRAYFLTPSDKDSKFSGKISKAPNSMENNNLKVKINKNGTLEITDKKTAQTYKDLLVFQDGGDAGDEYNYSPPIKDKIIDSRDGETSVSLVENGPVKATYKIVTKMNLPEGLAGSRKRRKSKTRECPITSYVTLYADSPRLDVRTIFDNNVKDHRLRVLFPTDIKTDHSNAESPFDVVRRPLTAEKKIDHDRLKAKWINSTPGYAPPGAFTLSIEEPVAIYPQQGFVSIDDGKKGLTILNKGLPAFEAMPTSKGTNVALTLVRGVGWLSLERDDFITRKSYNAGPTMETPEAQELGPHEFQYSILPHTGDWEEARAPSRAENFISGVKVVETGIHNGKLPAELSFVSTDNDRIIISAVKQAEDGRGVVVRLFNPSDKATDTKVKLFKKINKAYLANLNEKIKSQIEIDKDNSVKVNVRRKGIVTLRIE